MTLQPLLESDAQTEVNPWGGALPFRRRQNRYKPVSAYVIWGTFR